MGRNKPDLRQIKKLKAQYNKDPQSKLFFPIARIYQKINELDKAKEILEEGLKKYPNYYGAKAFLGEILFKTSDFDGAIAHLESVIKKVPEPNKTVPKLAIPMIEEVKKPAIKKVKMRKMRRKLNK